MPSVDFEVSDIPDIIEAQLTLSYSRLTQLLHSIVNQGNGHESDIVIIKARLDALENANRELQTELAKAREENVALRSEMECDKAMKGTSSVNGEDLANKLVALQERVEELSNAWNQEIKDLQSAFTLEKESHKQHNDKLNDATERLKDHFSDVQRKLSNHEKSIDVVHSFVKLWEVDPDKVRKLGSEVDNHAANESKAQVTHDNIHESCDAATQYLLSLHPFEFIATEVNVMKAMQAQQSVDVLSAKMAAAESVRNSRSNSQVKRGFDSSLIGPSGGNAITKRTSLLPPQQQEQQEKYEEEQEQRKELLQGRNDDLSLLVHDLENKVASLEANQKRLRSAVGLSSSSSSLLPSKTIATSNSNEVSNNKKQLSKTNEENELMSPEVVRQLITKDVSTLEQRMSNMEERLRALLDANIDAADKQERHTNNVHSEATESNATQFPLNNDNSKSLSANLNSGNGSAMLTDVRLRVKSLEEAINGLRKTVHFQTEQDALKLDTNNKQSGENQRSNANENAENVMTLKKETSETSVRDDLEWAAAKLPPLAPGMGKVDNQSLSPSTTPFSSSAQEKRLLPVNNDNNINVNSDKSNANYNQLESQERLTQLGQDKQHLLESEINMPIRCTEPACDVNDGLRKRVGQIEKNVVSLDLHKADRSELRNLQLDIQAQLALLQNAMPNDANLHLNESNNSNSNKVMYTPRRPLSANGLRHAQNQFQNDVNNNNSNNINNHYSYNPYANGNGMYAAGGGNRPHTASGPYTSYSTFPPEAYNSTIPNQQRGSNNYNNVGISSASSSTLPSQRGVLSAGAIGRPVYVSGGSINLRDGARLTSATISPSQTI